MAAFVRERQEVVSAVISGQHESALAGGIGETPEATIQKRGEIAAGGSILERKKVHLVEEPVEAGVSLAT